MPGLLSRFFDRRAQSSNLDETLNSPDMIGAIRGAGALSSTGVPVSPESSLRSTAVFACVRVLAETIAALPLVTYRRLPRGKERATDFYLYPILHDTPNPEMTSFIYRETITSHVVLWGNGYSEMQLDGAGRVVALWPLLPQYTVPMRAPDGTLFYKTYVPGVGYRGLTADRVFHVRGLGLNGLMGLSPIALARNAVGLSLATEDYGSRWFGNGSAPGLVLKYPGNLSDEQYEAAQASWEAAHGGLSNAHRVAILEGGITVEKIGIPNNDAQFLDTRKFQLTEIARLFRIPPHLIGDLERSTNNNIEQQSLEFVMYSMLPWFARWEQEISRSIMLEQERTNYFAEFLIDSLLRGDTTTRYNAYSSAINAGWMTRNEVRERENMNPAGAALDRYLEPLNMTEVVADAARSNIAARLEVLQKILLDEDVNSAGAADRPNGQNHNGRH
jgi:HK97 family phage portal protein